MKRTLMFVLLLGASVACTKEISEEPIVEKPSVETAESALNSFAQILSKAVGKDEVLRNFIKTDACRKFDKDYDVFYPFVKDRTLSDGRTFREAILSACDYEDELSKIETLCPKLTILVPDWSWIGSFNAHTWDTSSDEVLVGYAQEGERHSLYKDGKMYIELEAGEIPETVTLIVKENERMRYNGQTKAGEQAYEFASPVFDGEKNVETKGRAWYDEDIYLSYETIGDFVPASEIDPLVVRAYQEFGNSYSGPGCQRDLIYYSMTKNNDEHGVYNKYIRERFYRFKINIEGIRNKSDESEDPYFNEEIRTEGKDHELSKNQLIERIWSGGAFEFKFYIYKGTDGVKQTNYSDMIEYSAPGNVLFYLKKVHRRFKHNTMFSKGVSVYTLKTDDLVPKWVYPSGDVNLSEWNISEDSNNMYILAIEYDKSRIITTTEEKEFTYSKNFSTNINASGDIDKVKISLGLGGGISSQKKETSKVVIQTTSESDQLGFGEISYGNAIIRGVETKLINSEYVKGYNVKPFDFGGFSITLLPEDIRR